MWNVSKSIYKSFEYFSSIVAIVIRLDRWQHWLRVLVLLWVASRNLLAIVALRNIVVCCILWHHWAYGALIALIERLIHTVLHHVNRAVSALTALIGPSNHVKAVVEGILHHAHWLHRHRRCLLSLRCSPMWEESLVNLEQGAFIVNEQVKDMALVLAREIADLDTVLS